MPKQHEGQDAEVMDEDGSVVIVCHNLYCKEECTEHNCHENGTGKRNGNGN